MTSANRIYVVAPRTAEDGKPVPRRLVRAPNTAQALRHVADEFVVTLASQDDLIDLTAAGVKVENTNSNGGPSSG